GQLLKEMDGNGQRWKKHDNLKPKSHGGTSAPTLRNLGLTKQESHECQRLANMDDDSFEHTLKRGVAAWPKPCITYPHVSTRMAAVETAQGERFPHGRCTERETRTVEYRRPSPL